MSNIIEDESLECQICLEKFYSYEYLGPICLECGHTFCKRCITKMAEEKNFKCPIDKRNIELSSDTKYGMENFIIKKTIALMNCLEINVKPFCKLSLFFCSNCNIFISNFVKDIHLSVCHKVMNISAYTSKWFDYISNNIALKKITPTVIMYIIAYLFQSPYIFQSKQFEVKEILSMNNKMFTFYGENYALSERNKRFYKILKCLLSDSDDEYRNYSIKKGIIIGNNLQIIHGFFLIREAKPYLVKKGIGIVNFIDVHYFGIVSFMPKPQHSGFAFDYGILKQSGTFFMGTFNHNYFEFPIYNFVSGEEIVNEIHRTYVIRRPYLNDLTEETVEPFDEMAENNIYYKIKMNSICFKSIVTKIPKCEVRYTFNKPTEFNNGLLEIQINYNEEGESELEINIEKGKDQETPNGNSTFLSKIILQPIDLNLIANDYNYLQDKISDCYIKLNYKTVDLIIFFVKEDDKGTPSFNHIVVANVTPLDNDYCGYDIIFNENENTDYLKDLANFRLEEVLKNNPKLITYFHDLFNTKLTKCKVLYQLFKAKTTQRIANSLYYSFIPQENLITCIYDTIFKKNKLIRCEQLKEMTIKNIIPNIYCSESFEQLLPQLTIIDKNTPPKKNILKSCANNCGGCLIV